MIKKNKVTKTRKIEFYRASGAKEKRERERSFRHIKKVSMNGKRYRDRHTTKGKSQAQLD